MTFPTRIKTLALLIWAIPLPLAAQSGETREINPYKLAVGAHIGAAIANASVEPATGSGNRVGIALGAFAEAPILPGFFYFQPELNFAQKGAENTHFGSLATAKLSYLEMPLLAKIKFFIPRAKPFVMAGPSLAYLLGGSVEGPGVSFDRSRFNNLDVSFIVGAGFGFPIGDSLGAPEVSFTFRYSMGLNNLDAGASKWKSNAVNLLVGIQI